MLRALGGLVLVVGVLAGCGSSGGGRPEAHGTECPGPSAHPSAHEVPNPLEPDECDSSEPPDFDEDSTSPHLTRPAFSSRAASPVSSPVSSPTPPLSGSADVTCLVHGGAPWHVSKPDLESQLQGLLGAKFEVDSVHIDGDQTLTVTPGLQAIWTDETTSTVHAKLPDPPMPIVVTQVHHGTASGAWKVDGNALLPRGSWTGGLRTKTTMTIGGRTAQAPATGGVSELSQTKLVFTCENGALNVTVPGKSPFVYLFR